MIKKITMPLDIKALRCWTEGRSTKVAVKQLIVARRQKTEMPKNIQNCVEYILLPINPFFLYAVTLYLHII